MTSTTRRTPATIGVEIFKRAADDIVYAKQQVKQIQEIVKQDVNLMQTELSRQRERLRDLEKALEENEQMMAQCRARSADLLEKIELVTGDVAGLEIKTKYEDRIAVMNKRIDQFEVHMHEMRQLAEKCQTLETSNQSWCEKYDKQKMQWDKLYEKYLAMSEENHEQKKMIESLQNDE